MNDQSCNAAHTHTHACTHTLTCTHTLAYSYTRSRAHTLAYSHTHSHTHTHVFTGLDMDSCHLWDPEFVDYQTKTSNIQTVTGDDLGSSSQEFIQFRSANHRKVRGLWPLCVYVHPSSLFPLVCVCLSVCVCLVLLSKANVTKRHKRTPWQ
jgi:hypothetical protein